MNCFYLNCQQPEGIREINHVWACYAEPSASFYWQIVIFAYFAVLQVIGIVLAFQTRKVKLHGLRDSKFVSAIIYISSFLIVALAMETFTLRDYINIGAGIIAGGIFVLTTTFLSLIFIPKVSFYTYLSVTALLCLPQIHIAWL